MLGALICNLVLVFLGNSINLFVSSVSGVIEELWEMLKLCCFINSHMNKGFEKGCVTLMLRLYQGNKQIRWRKLFWSVVNIFIVLQKS